jgi:signal transduction histidine kinase/CheY-like chemotaxis protein
VAAPARASAQLSARIDDECTRVMYRQVPNSFTAAMGVTLYLIITLWRNVPHAWLGYWLCIQALAQVHRFWVWFGYRRAPVTAERNAFWRRRYAEYMFFAGLVWGLAALLFFRSESALAQVFTMCALYGIAGGAVSGNAYHPPALRAFVLPIFSAVMLRTLLIGRAEYIALGVASLFYLGILLLFCRVQHRSVLESIQIRFENLDLVEALKAKTADAERAKAKAEQADLAKSRFLAAASHDLRQPLHALGLFSATLRELELDQEQRAVVEQIYRNIDSLEALFDELLDISKLDAGYVHANPSHFAVQRLFDALDARYAPLAKEKGLFLRVRRSDQVLCSDPLLLERVLGNLVSNAIRYTTRGGVLVACRQRGQHAELGVWDTGIGVPREQQSRIFEEFFQIGNPERDRRKGLGLGLAIASRTARLLDTAIELRSELGRGSLFSLRVPLGDASAIEEPTSQAPASGDALTGCTVIVIDDEVSILEAMKELLARWGCEPIVARSAEQASLLARELSAKPALIVADYRLEGGTTGAQAVAELRRHFGRELPALLVTGDVAPERLAEAKQSGLHVLHKPLRPAQLRAMCNYLLTRS